MKASFIALAALVARGVGAQRVPAEHFELVGRFNNVSSRTGEHCEGYSLDLWRSGVDMLGLLTRHEGQAVPRCTGVKGYAIRMAGEFQTVAGMARACANFR